MSTTVKKPQKTARDRAGKSDLLKKLGKSTRRVVSSSLLPLLKQRGAEEVSLAEVRKRLSTLKTPLSREIIAERRKN